VYTETDNLLNVVNVIKFRCTLNFLLPITLAVIDKIFSDYRREEREIKLVRINTSRESG
jgi:hypothetical protein